MAMTLKFCVFFGVTVERVLTWPKLNLDEDGLEHNIFALSLMIIKYDIN